MNEPQRTQSWFVPPVDDDPAAWRNFDRLYVGHEFCEHLLPTPADVERVIAAKPAATPLTLVTPYVTDAGLVRVRELADRFLADGAFDEWVFNDWGVFRLLRERWGRPVLGRLLTRQLRDPRWLSLKREAPQNHGHIDDLALNEDFVRFLLDNGVRRVELDVIPTAWQWLPEDLRGSMYRPYTYASTTRHCLTANLDRRGNCSSRIPAGCGRECLERPLVFRHEALKCDLFLRGNTLFFRNQWDDAAPLPPFIDRVVRTQAHD
jgi:hypothetical protein